MGFSLNGKDIKELYYGNIKISEAWLNGQKVYSSVPLVSGIKYMFRDIDANGNLTLATGVLEDASEITEIGDYGLFCAFRDCSGLTGTVSFPNLTTIGEYGLGSAFQGCTGLTGSVSFPSLTEIGIDGLRNAFRDCTGLTSVSFPSLTTIKTGGLTYSFDGCDGITEVHFKSSMSGQSQCTSGNMGCTNATVYFDLP